MKGRPALAGAAVLVGVGFMVTSLPLLVANHEVEGAEEGLAAGLSLPLDVAFGLVMVALVGVGGCSQPGALGTPSGGSSSASGSGPGSPRSPGSTPPMRC